MRRQQEMNLRRLVLRLNEKLSSYGNRADAVFKKPLQQGVAEGALNEIYKMPPTKNSSQGMTIWAYNDALEKKSPILYKDNNVIIFKASEDLLRYIILQDGVPVLYLGLSKFLDGYKSGAVATEIAGRGKGLAQKAYLSASDILGVPIYSDTTQTDASRRGIWDKLIQQYPDRIVGYDQKTNKNLLLSLTDKGPTVNQNQPIYVDRNEKDTNKPITPNQRYRTRILKLLPKKQGVTEFRNKTDMGRQQEMDLRRLVLRLNEKLSSYGNRAGASPSFKDTRSDLGYGRTSNLWHDQRSGNDYFPYIDPVDEEDNELTDHEEETLELISKKRSADIAVNDPLAGHKTNPFYFAAGNTSLTVSDCFTRPDDVLREIAAVNSSLVPLPGKWRKAVKSGGQGAAVYLTVAHPVRTGMLRGWASAPYPVDDALELDEMKDDDEEDHEFQTIWDIIKKNAVF